MDIFEQLEDTKIRTLALFDLSDAELDKNRGEGSWSIRWILHHLADTETVLYERIRRTIAEPTRQVIWAFDQDAWTRGLNYDTLPLRISKGIYAAVRDGVIHQAKSHYQANGGRQYVHSEVGIRTLKEEFDKVAWHNERHLQQIAEALAK
jgi:hypothetical protein